MHNAVAIIGMGAHFPGAPDLDSFRRMIRSGVVQSRPVPRQRWDHAVVHDPNPRKPSKTPARKGAFLDDIDLFSAEFFGFTPKRARTVDPQQRLMLEVARQALEDAGYAARRLADSRVGVYVGASTCDHRTIASIPVHLPHDLEARCGMTAAASSAAMARLLRALPPINAYGLIGQQLNMIAANVSQAFGFKGPSLAIDTACSSALAALHEAVVHLRQGTIDAAVVGGVYVSLDPSIMVSLSKLGALSESDNCRPFQKDADGLLLGEGVGAVVLKRLGDALRDGDHVVAVVRGIAMNNDGSSLGPVTPSKAGQSEVIRRAWADADLDPSTVGLIEAHSVGTPAGDATELEALDEVFATRVRGTVPITSVKANIGHGLASAGMASLIKSSLAVSDRVVPCQPVSGPLVEAFTRKGAWLRIPHSSEVWEARGDCPRRAGVSAFGFGGTNVHVVLEEPPDEARCADCAPEPGWRFEFSAPNEELLAGYLEAVACALRERSLAPADVAHTLSLRRVDRVRVSFCARGEAELFDQLERTRQAVKRGHATVDARGAAGSGRVVSLPPSPVVRRRFWIVDESKLKLPDVRAPGSALSGGRAEAVQLVMDAICAVTAWREDELQPGMKLAADLGFDSLTTLEFMNVLGRCFPGLPAPPRSLFTPELTVAGVAEYVASAEPHAEAAKPRPALDFESGRHPWLLEHRPGGRPLLPIAALVEAALAAGGKGAATGLADFRVFAPVEVKDGAIGLVAGLSKDGSFALRPSGGGAVVATWRALDAPRALAAIAEAPCLPGPLPISTFYAEFGFHGPALRALAEAPLVAPEAALGKIKAGLDPVVMLDGALQLALYWLAVMRQRTAVATGFSEFRMLAPWPDAGVIRCVAALTGEQSAEFTGDFDLYGSSGALVAQWRGVKGRMLQGASAPQTAGPSDWPEVRALAGRKAALATAGIEMPYFARHDRVAAATTRIGGREFVNFSSYNYLGLAGDPAVNKAAADAVARYGTSVSASRVASGERPLHVELEGALARFLGCEDALSLVSGHATNVTLIGHLMGPEDLVVHDSLAHDCIVTGARLSGARRLVFPHNDMRALDELLRRERPNVRRALIAIEGVYSMDGDVAPLPEAVAIRNRHDALLLVDEAHSLGVLGATGRGIGEHWSVARGQVDLWMGTLSKSLASCGGYLAGSADLIDYLRFTLPGFVFSVGISPPNAAAALAALKILESRPDLPQLLQKRSELFRVLCREQGANIGTSAHSAIIPCITGSTERALRLAQALNARSINVQPIFYPAVEEGKARLRFFVSSGHTEEQLSATAAAIGEELAASRIDGGKVSV